MWSAEEGTPAAAFMFGVQHSLSNLCEFRSHRRISGRFGSRRVGAAGWTGHVVRKIDLAVVVQRSFRYRLLFRSIQLYLTSLGKCDCDPLVTVT